MSRWTREDNEEASSLVHPDHKGDGASRSPSSWRAVSFLIATSVVAVIVMYALALSMGLTGGFAVSREHGSSSTSSIPAVPDYFQTTPQRYAGPTVTAAVEPFLAQTYPAPFRNPTEYIPNSPLYTSLPIANVPNGTSIFELTGHLSSYFPAPGFGSNEYALPPGTNITHVNVLHRHGARYPTSDSSVSSFGDKIYDITRNGTAQWSGALSFLRNWKYTLGAEILTARGRQELFDSGVLHYYNYGGLYNTSTKIVARTTTQDRMLKSAEYFMAGFFGLEWSRNVTLEPQIEMPNFNSSLAGYFQCPNSNNFQLNTGNDASATWESIYLKDATARLQALSGDYNWTTADSYHAQTMCPYETVAFGYSAWCDIFTYEEWQGFEYSIDLQFNGNAGFASPSARGIGIGYVQELFARLQGHLYDLPPGATNVNRTLDTMESTFPLNQTLYFDFSHDTNIMAIITAFGLRQFAEKLPAASMPANRSLIVSHVTPFAARMVWEVIQAPHPVKARRPTGTNNTAASYYESGDATTYAHLLIGQRTVPLHLSYPECEERDDGWCDMNTFLSILNATLATTRYEYSCFGNYSAVPYGSITNGVPITKRDIDLGMALGGRGSDM